MRAVQFVLNPVPFVKAQAAAAVALAGEKIVVAVADQSAVAPGLAAPGFNSVEVYGEVCASVIRKSEVEPNSSLLIESPSGYMRLSQPKPASAGAIRCVASVAQSISRPAAVPHKETDMICAD